MPSASDACTQRSHGARCICDARPTMAPLLRSFGCMARKITDIMTPQPECCTPDDSVIEAARVMEARDVGIVPIVESQDTRRLVGVITDRDIVLRVVAQGYDPNEIV